MVKKNILHFLRSYGFHGGEKQIIHIASIRHENYKQYYIDIHYDAEIERIAQKKNINYDYLLPFKITIKNIFFELLLIFFLSPYLCTKFLIFLTKKNIRLVFCHNIQSACVSWPLIFLLKTIKFVYFHRIYKLFRKYDFFSKIIYYPFNEIIGNSKSVANSLKKYSGKKILVINNFVETNYKNKKINNRSNLIFVTVSRLEKRKRIDFLIDMFDYLKSKYKNILFYILGDGNEEKNLKKRVYLCKNKNIIFLGNVKKPSDVLNKSDIYLCASELEGLSNSILEAMSIGLPSVIVDAPGVSDCHIKNVTALFADRNIKDFSKKCEKLINNIQLRKFLSQKAQNKVKNEYNINNTFNEYLKIYNKHT